MRTVKNTTTPTRPGVGNYSDHLDDGDVDVSDEDMYADEAVEGKDGYWGHDHRGKWGWHWGRSRG